MPNHIHQHGLLAHPLQELATPPQPLLLLAAHPIPPCHLAHTPPPLAPYRKRLLPPRFERDLLHHRRRRDFFALETAPRDRVHGVGGLAGGEFGGGVGGVVGHLPLGVEAAEVGVEGSGEDVARDEELDKGLLEDESARGTPAVDAVVRGKAVDGGLGGDGPEGVEVGEVREFGFDERGFGGEGGGFGPRESGWVVAG